MINGINNNLFGQLPITSRHANSMRQNTSSSVGFGRIGANLVQTVPNLTDKEAEILNRISKLVGSAVKINQGDYTSDCGLTIATIGFDGVGACGTRSPFMITHKMLSRMAEDESVYRERMAWINETLQQQNTLESSLAENRRLAEEDDAERRAQHIRANIRNVADSFWIENQSDNTPLTQNQQSHEIKRAIGQYEQMLSVR